MVFASSYFVGIQQLNGLLNFKSRLQNRDGEAFIVNIFFQVVLGALDRARIPGLVRDNGARGAWLTQDLLGAFAHCSLLLALAIARLLNNHGIFVTI